MFKSSNRTRVDLKFSGWRKVISDSARTLLQLPLFFHVKLLAHMF
jgi:hypothetical protein